MKLLFVYIHEYKSLKKQSFNLSSDYEISFDYLYNPEGEFYKKGGLKIEESSFQTPKYFNKNFSDIKGVIGENGAGKSTLLQYLAFRMHEREFDLYGVEQYFDFIIFEDNNKINIVYGKHWEGIIEITSSLSKSLLKAETQPNWRNISFDLDVIY